MNYFTYSGGLNLGYNGFDLKILFCFLLAFLITLLLIPALVAIARKKSLYDEPNGRKSHTISTPTLGGIAIFNGVAISTLLFFNFGGFPTFNFAIAGLLIIFLAGIRDDLIGITPFQKFAAQLIAVTIMVVFGGIRFTHLHGFIGIWDINNHVGLMLSVIAIVGITNCFNLMDGIDGLSASMGVLVASTFGIWFFLVGESDWAILSFGLTGSLIAFFIYNVFGKKNKIFMGDSGSLILGYILAIMVIRFNEANIAQSSSYYIFAAPAVSLGILMVPVFDTLRVFVSRIFRNASPFTADRTHIHHYLLELGFSHLQATIILFLAGVFFVVVSFLLRKLSVAWLIIVLFILASILSYIPIGLVYWRRRRGKVTTAGD